MPKLDPISVNGKEYTPLRRMNFGEVNTLRESSTTLLNFVDSYSAKPAEELSGLELSSLSKMLVSTQNHEQKLAATVLKSCFGMSQEELEKMDYVDSMVLFGELYILSTLGHGLKKKSVAPSDSLSPSTT